MFFSEEGLNVTCGSSVAPVTFGLVLCGYLGRLLGLLVSLNTKRLAEIRRNGLGSEVPTQRHPVLPVARSEVGT